MDIGKENGSYYVGFRVWVKGLWIYWDNGKENGSYYLGFRVWVKGLWILEKRMEATI